MSIIGRLERVPLREVWKHEAYDFSVWLQQNVDVLNEALGVTLTNVEREQSAGAFSIDMVAEDEAGAKVIIENQLERSNHDHLGKVLTYVAAMQAKTAVWIVAEARAEHVAAIAWLNESGAANFYLLMVEAVRIGDSPAAPLLTRIVGPSAATEAAARSNRQFAEREEVRREWWTLLVARPDVTLHRQISPSTTPYLGARIAPGLSLNFCTWQEAFAVELYIDSPDLDANVRAFEKLKAAKEQIEQAFGAALEWDDMPGKRACRIRFTGPGGYRWKEDEWDEIQQRQADAMNRLHAAIRPYLPSVSTGT
jgi:hypothetical protein